MSELTSGSRSVAVALSSGAVADLRAKGRALVQGEYDAVMPELLAKIREIVDHGTVYKTICPNPRCGRQVSMPGPDLKAVLAAAQWYQAQVLGTPGRAADPPAPLVEPDVPYGELSDAQLAELAKGAG